MTAAIAAARQGAEVTVLERNDRVGKKILSTGNGKCNLSNRLLTREQYYGGNMDFVMGSLERFGTEDTIAFFESLGLMIKDKNGYLYPVSEQASVVLDVLRMELSALSVEVVTGCRISRIASEGSGEKKRFTVSDGQRSFSFDRVILACGGRAAPATGSDGTGYKLAGQMGHHLVEPAPALVQLRCREDYFKSVSGVRADALVSLWKDGECAACERGELQLTDYGISGIPVFQISRCAAYLLKEQKEVKIHINLMPDYGKQDLEKLCRSRRELLGGRTVEEFFTGMLHKKLMQLFIRLAGLKFSQPVEQVKPQALQKVFSLCTDWQVTVIAANPYENAQVSAGGVCLEEITENMESCLVPGLYFAGELMDVDGKCGGYNLQWAWCSGYLAGMAAGGDK